MRKLKLISAALIACMLLGAASCAFAEVGDAVGSIYSTDILAYVNNRPIPSYCLDGKTAVLVEDLDVGGIDGDAHYGFNWWYDDNTRTLTANSDGSSGYGEPLNIERGEVGKILDNIYETDIKVIFNGLEVPSFAINGKTAVCIEDLGTVEPDGPNADYGYSKYMCNFTWDGDTREVRLYTYQTNNLRDIPLHKMVYQFTDNKLSVSFDQLNYYLNQVSGDCSDEFVADFNHIKPVLLDGETVGTMYVDHDGFLSYNVDTLKIFDMKKDLEVILSYDEAVKFITGNYEICDSREIGGATVYLAKDKDGNRDLFYALKQGGLVLESEFENSYTTVEFSDYEDGLYVKVYPFAGPHGATTMRQKVNAEMYQRSN